METATIMELQPNQWELLLVSLECQGLEKSPDIGPVYSPEIVNKSMECSFFIHLYTIARFVLPLMSLRCPLPHTFSHLLGCYGLVVTFYGALLHLPIDRYLFSQDHGGSSVGPPKGFESREAS